MSKQLATTVEFHTRPDWDDHGDLYIDGEDQGWQSLAYAQSVAVNNLTELHIVQGETYVVRNPRREA